MTGYSFSDAAVQDLNEICDYLAREDVRVASRFFDAVRKKCKLVADFPGMGKRYEQLAPQLRGFTIEKYLVFYYVRENGVDIVRVVSGRRDLDALFTSSED